MITRRKFIHSSLLAGTGLFTGAAFHLLNGCASSCGCLQPQKKHNYVLADIHNHTVQNYWLRNTPIGIKSPMLADFARDAFDKTSTSWQSSYEAGVDLICTAHFNLFDEWITMPSDSKSFSSRKCVSYDGASGK